MKITEKIKKFVEAECKKPTSKYGYEPYIHHFIPVVAYAKKLARKLGGDIEIIELAAWLHDIGSIKCGRENHHITGAKIAEIKLREFGYPEDRIKRVRDCIMNHRGSQKIIGRSIEEKIIAEADALSAFDNLSGIFKAAFVYEKLNQAEAKKSARQKLMNKWRQLHLVESKKIIRPKYEAAMIILK